MVQLLAFRQSLRASLRVLALALCSASIAVSVTPAHARSHHGAGRHARAYHAGHHARRHYAHIHRRHLTEASRWERGMAQMQAGGFTNTNASFAPNASADPNSTLTPTGGAMASSFGSSNVVAEARRYIGGNPTGRGSLWCARFMNLVLQHSGYRGTGSDMASSFAHYGQRVSGPQVGAIAVMGRRGGGHVGIITGIDAAGNPIMISGNNGNRVKEAPISRGRIYAYVMPTG
ncbi:MULTISPECIES: TIGR02594 family protein [Bradyrhizobium]|uniref:TIGR02594 family protein n=2 Tax=Bradyrhizobium TaxID=374 RepID=A0ABY0PIB5_9BRAD|nr:MULTISPECIES: TIGR02594 family protein [Bradyrhizobium]SDI44418.1 TIGR02594 family protein [Bradyrhizobium ottawaense]